MLVNARHVVAEREAAPALRVTGDRDTGGPALLDEPLVTLRTEASGDRMSIVIADRGVGINAADLSHVFDPYFTTKRGGTGLGLAIAKNIIEGLGGTIAVSSAPGRGADIHVTLPFDTAQGGPLDAAQGRPVDSAQGRPA